MPLTDEDRNYVHQAFAHGPAALLNVGFSLGGISDFLVRPDVQEEWLVLNMEFRAQATLTATRRFMLTRQLSGLGDGAVAVMGQGMLGCEYARDEDGNISRDARGLPIIREMEISPVQLRSAEGILDRLGLSSAARNDRTAAVATTETLFKQLGDEESRYEDDPLLETEEQRALSREKVRNMILRLTGPVLEARARVIDELGYDKSKTKKKKRRKASTNGRAKKKQKTKSKTKAKKARGHKT